MKRSDKWPRFPILKINPEDIGRYYIGSIIGGGDRPADVTNIGAWYNEVRNFQDAALSTRLGIPMLFAIDAIQSWKREPARSNRIPARNRSRGYPRLGTRPKDWASHR